MSVSFKTKIFIIVLGSFAVGVSGYALVRQNAARVGDFSACAMAGHPITASYPVRCRLPNGREFVQPTQGQALRETCARAKIPDVSFSAVYDQETRTVDVHWNDVPGRHESMLILPYEPELDFPSCSQPARRVLEHVRRTQKF